jgi:predicted nucleotidyltransferase
MGDLLSRCSFPILNPPYDRALREAVTFILERYMPTGILAAGSILHGCPDTTSDLDLYVIHTASFRQRLQWDSAPEEVKPA